MPRTTAAVAMCAICITTGTAIYFRVPRLVERPGFSCQSIAHQGTTARFVMFQPHVPPPSDEGYPVILFLNGFGENGDDGVAQLSNNFGAEVWELKRRFPFIVVAVQCRKSGSWAGESPDTARALAALRRVTDKFEVDEERVYVTGPSSGGSGALAVAAAYPAVFAGVVSVCPASSLMPIEDVVESFRKQGIAVWCLYNKGDSGAVVGFNETLRKHLLRSGQSPLFTAFNRSGHNAWDPTYRNPAIYDWMLRHTRRSNINLAKTPFTAALGEPSLASVPAESHSWSYEGDAVSDDFATVAKSSEILWMTESAVSFDFHFDYLTPTENSCEVIMQAADGKRENPSQSVLRLVVGPTGIARGGLLSVDNQEWLARTDCVAEFAFRKNAWNDIRIHRRGTHLTVFVNGWQLLDTDVGHSAPFKMGFLPTSGQGDKWKTMRIRYFGEMTRS